MVEVRGAAHKVFQLIQAPTLAPHGCSDPLEMESIGQAVEIQHVRRRSAVGELLVGDQRRFVVMEWRDGECVLR